MPKPPKAKAKKPKVEKPGGFYRAYVRALIGDRFVSKFVESAGLGVTGVGEPHTMQIDYKPGEVVDQARVIRAMDKTIEDMAEQNTSSVILHYEILAIKFIEPTGVADANDSK